MSPSTDKKILNDIKSPFTNPLLLYSFVVIIICGGYALELIDLIQIGFKTAELSAILLFFEGLWFLSVDQQNQKNMDYLIRGVIIFFFILIIVLTLAITICHIWWPKTCASAGVIINLLIYGFLINDYFNEKNHSTISQTVRS